MKNKNVAGILALLFGLFGVHRFYLGQRFLGIIYFALSMFGILMAVEEGAPIIVAPAILGFIDSILLFAMPREDFDDKYNAKHRRHSHRRDWNRYSEERYRSSAPSPSAYKSSGIKNFRNYYFEEAAEDFEMALDLAPWRIRVNTLVPGNTEVEHSRGGAIGPEAAKATIPLGYPALPADIGAAAAFLASDDAAYITGQRLIVDGGMDAQLRSPGVDTQIDLSIAERI